ncbi:hypothetical protein ACOSQ3_009719 [Xanthoceras sorbifolium]
MNINICISRIQNSFCKGYIYQATGSCAQAKGQATGVSLRQSQAQENPERAPHQSDHKCKDRSKALIPYSVQSSKFTHVCYHCGVKGHIRP